MEWWLLLLCFFAGLMVIMAAGVPVAFSFIIVNLAAAVLLFGGTNAASLLILSMYDALVKFSLTSIPLFVLMGELLYHSGIVSTVLNSISMWIGKLPGRLSLISVSGGAVFANLSGSSVANTAVLGTMLVPEMQKNGYSKTMSFGPIMAGAGLAMVIPPSTIAILLGSIGKISVGPLLIGGILPGILMAVLYVVYIIVRCSLNPALAPKYESERFSLAEKLKSTAQSMIPVAVIMFMVLGTIFLGVATPTEAASLGTLGAFLLTVAYRKCSKEMLRKSIMGTVKLTGTIMFIVAGAAGFSQLLSLTGTTRALLNLVTGLAVEPVMMVIVMMVIVFILGMFLEQIPIMMITLPVFIPVIMALDVDPIWFGIIMLINMHIGTYSPPFGLVLFVMKGVAPAGTAMLDIYKSAIPFIMLDILAIIILFIFPDIVTFLPRLMSDG